MASSRIFVKGLPPTFSEHDFRKHFSKGFTVTDAKLLPNRRIGYVGFKSPEEAAKAVKYFNRTFIKMSKIGVELARPVADESLPTPRRGRQAPTSKVALESVKDQATENPLKRKRDVVQAEKDDAKLKEYLEVMQPPSKSKSWANDGGVPLPEVADPENTVKDVAVDGAASDDEYESIPKRNKKSEARTSEVVQPPDQETGADVQTSKEDIPRDSPQAPPAQHSTTEEIPADTVANQGPVNDADWLRSRTSRLLGLIDDDEELPNGAPARMSPSPDRGAPQLDVSAQAANAEEAEPEASPNEDQALPNNDENDDEPEDAEITKIRASKRLFLRNLPYSVTEDELREVFQEYGEIEEVHVPMDFETGRCKGFAYLLFEDAEAAIAAFQNLDGKIFQGRLLHIIAASPKRENKLDDFAISKLPLKKQKQIQRKAQAASATFNWNALYMNQDAVISSISDRMGVSKSDLLDPTSADAAVKMAQAETHVIQETKAYFSENGVDLDSFRKKERGDTAILVKNFPYGTKPEELKAMFKEQGEVTRFLMPPSGTIAIVEFAQPPQARSAFATLAYRKIKDSVLFLEKAPKNLFTTAPSAALPKMAPAPAPAATMKVSATDLLAENRPDTALDTTTLFVRNLNFSTTNARLTEVFKPLEGFMSARVKTKTDPKKPGQVLSMGFGFLEFRTKQQAEAALAAMDGYNLDGHQVQIRASHKGMDAAEERRKEDAAKKAASKGTKIIIKNLPFETTKKDVRALFSSYGQLRSVRVPKKFDNSARGYAFAEFITPREAENAVDALRNTHLLGRRLVLEFAAEDPEDAEAEIERMQKKVGSQVNKVALQKLVGAGRKKFAVGGDDDADGA